MWLSGLLLAATLTLAPSPASSAPSLQATPQFRHYDVNQGLPSSDVYIIRQDANGILWLGTRAGMARFDGNDFKIYQHVPGDDTSLAANDTSGLLVDSHGRIWAGGEASGVNLFDRDTETFTHYRHDPDDPHSLSSNDVMYMTEGSDGSLWVATWSGGLDHMVAPGRFEHLRHDPNNPDSLINDNVLSLALLPDGRLLIGTMQGLDIRQPDGHLTHVRFASGDAPIIWGINADATDVRIAAETGLFRLDDDNVARRFKGAEDIHNTLNSLRTPDGNLWIGTLNGLYLKEPGKPAIHLGTDTLTPGGQPGRVIWHLMIDDEGGLWLASQNAGIAYLGPDWRDFSHYGHRADDPDSLDGGRSQAVAPSHDGKLWVGSSNGRLDKLDPETGTVTHYTNAAALNGTPIMTIAEFGADKLWLGTHDALVMFDGQRVHRLNGPASHTGSLWVIVGPDKTAWAAPAMGAVVRVDPHSLDSTALTNAYPGDADKATRDLDLHDGMVWRATAAGLSRAALDQSRFKPVPGIAKGVIHNLCFDGTDLWLARPDALEKYRLDAAGGAHLLQRIDTGHGWSGFRPYTMTTDDHGRVWMFSPTGMRRYDPATGKFRAFGKAEGLPSSEFPGKSLVHDAHGNIFIGTQRGVIGFNPDRLHDHPRAPRVNLTDITVQREHHTVHLDPGRQGLHLQWRDRDLRVNAHALSYINPSSNRYRFRLTGLDNQWVETGNHGRREFAGLAAGSYTLQVEAAGPSGVWGKLQTPLSIHVDLPPWQQPWAWLLYALALLMALWSAATIWRRRLDQHHHLALLEREREMAKQADAAKSRFLATLSHEIRTPMTGMLGMTELLLGSPLGERERHCAQTILQSGQLMLKLVNDSLDLSRIEAGRLSLEPVPLDPRALLAGIRELQQPQAQRKHLAWHVDVDGSVPPGLRGDGHRIQQILLNLTNNAFKFTTQGRVGIAAHYDDGTLHLVVHDTGAGISDADRERLFHRYEQADSPERQNGTGLGLAICRELVQLMGGEITLASTPGTGSRFDIRLPLPECAPPTSATAASPPASGPHRRLHLLLVEDDPIVAQVVCGILEQAGHRVIHAAHGLAALEELASGHVDVILMDMNLPGMDGCQLTRLIRDRDDDSAALPIIAVTARSGTDEERQAQAAGMDAFLRKPVTLDQLTRTFDRLGIGRATTPPGAADEPA